MLTASNQMLRSRMPGSRKYTARTTGRNKKTKMGELKTNDDLDACAAKRRPVARQRPCGRMGLF
jgi:hypothetical protein